MKTVEITFHRIPGRASGTVEWVVRGPSDAVMPGATVTGRDEYGKPHSTLCGAEVFPDDKRPDVPGPIGVCAVQPACAEECERAFQVGREVDYVLLGTLIPTLRRDRISGRLESRISPSSSLADTAAADCFDAAIDEINDGLSYNELGDMEPA